LRNIEGDLNTHHQSMVIVDQCARSSSAGGRPWVAPDKIPEPAPGTLHNLARTLPTVQPRSHLPHLALARLPQHVRAIPHCGLKFEREQSYFVGAMYISYLLSITGPRNRAAALADHGWSFNTVMLGASFVYLPLVPAATRFARVVWTYLDRHFDL